MAFQPKSYRKFVVASASAALVGAAVAPASAGAAEATTAAEAFTDVTVDTPQYEHINALYQEGIINGFEDGEFKRNEYVPRSQAAEMIFNALGLEEADDLSDFTFTDVNERLKEEIQALVDEDIFDGHSDTEFGYAEDLTREQMAKVLVEAFDLPQEDVPEADFTDLMDTSLYTYINAAAAAGITDGYEDGSFGVGDPIKRGDFAKMLHNAYEMWKTVDPSVSEVGTVKSTIAGVYAVQIPVSNLDDATSESMVSVMVGDDKVELTYDSELDSFLNLQVSGYSEDELKSATVHVESDDDSEDDSDEVVKYGTVADLNGTVKTTIAGVYAVQVKPSDIDGVTKDDSVALWVGEDMIELTYDSDLDAFANLQVSGYSEADLEGAEVTSN